ncbi:MAG: hypothetical protein R3F13_19575 [Prosthecobacter sp.]
MLRPHNPAPARSASFAALLAASTFVLHLLTPGGAHAQITRAENLNLILGPGSASPPVVERPTVHECAPGPWGNLRYVYVYLEAPYQLIENFPLPSTTPSWAFETQRLSELPKLFADAGLSQALIDYLVAEKNIVRDRDTIYLHPPLAELEEMSPAARTVIYPQLAKHPANAYHADPVIITSPSIEEWYATSKLRPEIIAKIKKLSYVRNNTNVFSDVSLLLNYAQSDTEARAIFKACTRTRTIMVRLHLDKNSNSEEILRYWSLGLGLRRKDIEPLLDSIIETNGIEDISLSHLLPPLARKLIYTYPGAELARHGTLPDCHWTSLNFFNYEPHEYLLDVSLATSRVLEQFTQVEKPYQYGDILFFLDDTTGDAFHSCVYLADDLVYTKNGRNILSPWVIMKIEDVQKIYLYRGEGTVQAFRARSEETNPDKRTSE